MTTPISRLSRHTLRAISIRTANFVDGLADQLAVYPEGRAGDNQKRREPLRRYLAKLDAMVAQCFGSKDYIEGRCTFMEKRKPQFRGR